jgi:putative membrane-bound dehydrogenase-like protein
MIVRMDTSASRGPAMRHTLLVFLSLTMPSVALTADGNRLAYLDGSDPYYVHRGFARLTTPQWVGEDGVDAVVVLAIDDMRGHEKWEQFLRPILRRLQKIDGRAPVSIMTCQVDPKDPHLQKWLEQGLSLETHTIDHPCPLLAGGDLEKARSTYDRCIDLLASVEGNRPVAFRMPCCDSLNTLSPRFYTELFRRPTAKGNFLTLDSSVFCLLTANDPELPRELVLDRDGTERFRRYIPADRPFGNTIEDYPYPYLIDRLCWEFPCITPSDWQSKNLQGPGNPLLLRDWKAALDAVVRKKGTFNLVFHPYGWSKPEQIVDLIDHAERTHGKKVRFLTFREAQERLNRHLLGGQPVRAADGGDNGVRLIDLNGDGAMDVVIGNDRVRHTRLWVKGRGWVTSDFPVPLVEDDGKGRRRDAGVRFGILDARGNASVLVRTEKRAGAWRFTGSRWEAAPELLAGLEIDGKPVFTARDGRDLGVRLRDLDGDGICELIVGNDREQAVFAWSADDKHWRRLPWSLPEGTRIVDGRGSDAGLRFVDVDDDGQLDVLFSSEERSSLHLFQSKEKGWARQALAAKHGEAKALPVIARGGANNGAWFHGRELWVQNEHTAVLKDLVERRSFNDMLLSIEPAARTAAASLRSLHARPGFQVEQMAAEPMVLDPIALAWGPDGKLWVVEMGDYPLGLDGKGKPGGRILVLEDTRGDGKYDKVTVFLDKVGFPTGVLPWGKGVLVSCAPDIFYAEDTDGDGKADKREVLYTGFGEGNQQHRVNGFVYGLDNWLYCANGDSGGVIRSLKTGAKVDIRGRDFRIRPADGAIEAVTGGTQFGRCRDDWGNWFGGNNSNPLWHYALDDHYLRRNPHLAYPDPRITVPVIPGAAPVFPLSRTMPRFNDPGGANRFTSACSPIIYRDNLFGPAFAGNSFVSEPVHDLVHREVLSPKGVTFTSRRAADEERSEFLASTDNWCRPTSIRIGPDGALWVADMYRHVIEHPQWIPLDWQKRLDLRAGHDQGRIYRVYPVGARPRAIPRLDRLDGPALAAALDTPGGWQRDMGQQLLVERQDRTAVLTLEKLLTSPRPLTRLHALCTLDGLGALRDDPLVAAMQDPHPGVRRHAVRLCDARLAKSPQLGPMLLKLSGDPDSTVRMQLAYTLGEWNDARAGRALGELALRDGGDRYFAAAVLSSVNEKNLEPVLQVVLAAREAAPAGLVEQLMRLATATGNTKALAALIAAATTAEKGGYAPGQLAALAGLLDVLDRRGASLAGLRTGSAGELRAALDRLPKVFEHARRVAADAKAPVADRAAAAGLLGRGFDHQREDIDLLAELLLPQAPDDVQAAAVTTLGKLKGKRIAEVLLQSWKSQGPHSRGLTLDVLLSRDDWATALVDALEAKRLPAAEIDSARQQRLLTHKVAELRERSRRLLAASLNPDRRKVVDTYRPALALKGDVARGKQVFGKTCATCHKLDGAGNEVGPDLAALADKAAETLLIAILDPNQAVESRYINYVAQTKTGRTFTGLIASETGTSLTLVGPDGKPQVVLRADLEELTSSGKSLMPEGLEKDIRPQDMADLLAYLKGRTSSAKRKSFAGNTPEVVRPAADGSLLLTAKTCEIYGTTLVFEDKYANLGFWANEDDHAVWTVELRQRGRYTVWLDYACTDGSAGDTFQLHAGDERLTGKVAGTGSWDDYRQTKVGEIALAAGRQRLVFRSLGKIEHGALIDLKSVKLLRVAP